MKMFLVLVCGVLVVVSIDFFIGVDMYKSFGSMKTIFHDVSYMLWGMVIAHVVGRS